MSFKQTFKTGWSFSWRFALWQLTTLPLLIIMLTVSGYAKDASVTYMKFALLTIVVTTLLREFISIYLAGHVFKKVKQKYDKENYTLYIK